MKICDVVKDSIWFDPRVRKQVLEYVNRGIELVCVGTKDNRYDEKRVKEIPCQVHLVPMKASYSKRIPIVHKILREVCTNRDIYHEILKTKPDIIHANDLNALIPAYRASKKLKCGLIYDTHEIFLENPWIARNKFIKFVWGWFEKRIIHKVDLVVCVSHAAGDYLQKQYGIPAPMVVTNCIRRSECIVEQPDKRAPKEVLNHGQFYEGRGYETMIQTAPLVQDLEDVKLVIRGLGGREAMLREMAAEFNSPNFRMDPPVLVDELIPEASKAWAGVAITEPISINFELSVSNKLFEYAAAGIPVIMSDIPEHRYLNGKYGFGVILEEDTPKALAAAIRTLYEDDVLYRSCVAGSWKMSQEINWENEFGKLIEKEKELCGL